MELLDLPAELILVIEEHLPTQADVLALMRCHPCMLAILQQRLYARPKGEKITEIFDWAIERGNERLVSAMLDQGADKIFTELGAGALSNATMRGQLNMVKLVLEHPQTINKPTPTDDESHTAIMIATLHEYTEIVKLLLAQPHLHPQKPSSLFFEKTLKKIVIGEELDDDDSWDIPINQALYSGSRKLVRILLADPRVELTSLSLIAAARGGYEDMVMLCLLQYPQQFDPDHESLLVIATRDNNMRLVQFLLKVAGLIPHMKWEIDGKTSFVSAANQEILAPDHPLLARNNISVKATDYDGKSPFIYSASHGNVEMMKLLFSTGEVNVDSPDRLGRTPLSYAAEQAGGQAVKFLLSLDAVNPRLKDYYGMTPLHYAAEFGDDVAVMKVLLILGMLMLIPWTKRVKRHFHLPLRWKRGSSAVLNPKSRITVAEGS
ncbi:hypothetical protein N7516_006320 [Penicillium verrucosum]|uniref:uncharacterized protein n=1 Tax=Penicillium verrucosum TaxID=60171 RepID=UPI00254594AF|nr:uncharacterized protein N7516_006320 [Penicillium verrucosum]KAJ5931831.1 hypothetical protein N7516_006320 [Penicillium verrucosum]